jgi:diacylglycerol kinase
MYIRGRTGELVSEENHHSGGTWARKFRCAFRGIWCGIYGQRSFYVHLPMAAAVIVFAAILRAEVWQWCVLLLCITCVLTAEMLNTVLEYFAKMITDKHDERMRDALDMGSAAVLIASIGAAIIGTIVFIDLLLTRLN